jgi:N-acetylglucosamine kinase-like BadF-type ATPase
MPYYLAIDAGGTKTNCLLADRDRILARASTGSIKLMRTPEPEATTRLHAMLSEVSAAANIPLTHITRTCIGLAGLTIPTVHHWATQAISARVSGSLLLLGDDEIALDAAFHSGPTPGSPANSTRWGGGILIIAGTGSNIIGRAPDGSLHHAGGWGPILGDEGAGYWIGLEAIRAALRAQDQESLQPSSTIPSETGAPSMTASPSWVGSKSPAPPSTQLLTEIQKHWNLPSLAALIELGNHRGDATRPAPDFAALAPIVARLAEPTPHHPANPIAAATLHRAGADLADQVTLVAQKMAAQKMAAHELGAPFMTVPSSWVGSEAPLAIAFTGSVLTHIAPVRQAMLDRLAITLPNARVHPTPADPLDGALYRARHA